MTEILISSRTWDKPQFKQMCGESMKCNAVDHTALCSSTSPTLSVKPHTQRRVDSPSPSLRW